MNETEKYFIDQIDILMKAMTKIECLIPEIDKDFMEISGMSKCTHKINTLCDQIVRASE